MGCNCCKPKSIKVKKKRVDGLFEMPTSSQRNKILPENRETFEGITPESLRQHITKNLDKPKIQTSKKVFPSLENLNIDWKSSSMGSLGAQQPQRQQKRKKSQQKKSKFLCNASQSRVPSYGSTNNLYMKAFPERIQRLRRQSLKVKTESMLMVNSGLRKRTKRRRSSRGFNYQEGAPKKKSHFAKFSKPRRKSGLAEKSKFNRSGSSRSSVQAGSEDSEKSKSDKKSGVGDEAGKRSSQGSRSSEDDDNKDNAEISLDSLREPSGIGEDQKNGDGEEEEVGLAAVVGSRGKAKNIAEYLSSSFTHISNAFNNLKQRPVGTDPAKRRESLGKLSFYSTGAEAAPLDENQFLNIASKYIVEDGRKKSLADGDEGAVGSQRQNQIGDVGAEDEAKKVRKIQKSISYNRRKDSVDILQDQVESEKRSQRSSARFKKKKTKRKGVQNWGPRLSESRGLNTEKSADPFVLVGVGTRRRFTTTRAKKNSLQFTLPTKNDRNSAGYPSKESSLNVMSRTRTGKLADTTASKATPAPRISQILSTKARELSGGSELMESQKPLLQAQENEEGIIAKNVLVLPSKEMDMADAKQSCSESSFMLDDFDKTQDSLYDAVFGIPDRNEDDSDDSSSR